MSVNSVGLLTVSELYWLRSRNFLRTKKSLCFPEFSVLTSGKLGVKEEITHLVYGDTTYES